MDLDARLRIVQLYYQHGCSPIVTLRAYKKENNLIHDPFTCRAISDLIKKFEETKSLHDKSRSGRPSLDEERQAPIMDALQTVQSASPYGIATSSQVSNRTGIPASSVRRIMRKSIGLYPYKLTTAQAITDDDKVKRLAFAEYLLAHEDIIDTILWTDEAYFSLDGRVNTHNCVIWAFEKPSQSLARHLHSPKICVWMGLTATFKLKPFFFPATVNADNYLDLLRDHVMPQLRRKRKMSTVVFQQDGAPPHYGTAVRNFLKENFPETRIIARGVGTPWPPRSPDLSPMDYWFWGMVKARVYHAHRPTSLDELQQLITDTIDAIEESELQRAVESIIPRLQLVQQENGGVFSHLM